MENFKIYYAIEIDGLAFYDRKQIKNNKHVLMAKTDLNRNIKMYHHSATDKAKLVMQILALTIDPYKNDNKKIKLFNGKKPEFTKEATAIYFHHIGLYQPDEPSIFIDEIINEYYEIYKELNKNE